MRYAVFAIALAGSAGVSPWRAHASPVSAAEILTQLNAVFAGRFASSSDVEGRLVAGELAGGATFYSNPNPAAGPSSFQAVNAISIDAGVRGNVNNGGSVDYVASNAGSFSFNGGGGLLLAMPVFSIADLTAPLQVLSDTIHGQAANSTVNTVDPNSFTFDETPDAAGTAVFRLSAALLQSAANIQFSGGASTILIDVTGPSFTETGNLNGGAFLNQHVIWNFHDATALTLKGWHGAVLAGSALLTNTSAIEGFVYADSFGGEGELHDAPFLGRVPGEPARVPEPASLLLAGSGMLGLWLLTRRRLRVRSEPQRTRGF